MKKLLAPAIILLLSFLFISYHFQPAKNQIVAFGAIKSDNERISGVSVIVLHNNEVVENMVTGRLGAYGFSLQFNSEYTIVIVKKGYLKETIQIDTHVPEDVISYGADILWEPDFTLYKIMPGLTIDEFKAPLAKYIFDAEYWGFLEDRSYRTEVEPIVTAVIADIDTLRKIAYLFEMRKADSLFNIQNYEEAIIVYHGAQRYSNDDNYGDKQIKAAKKLLKNQYTGAEGYMQALRKADEFFRKNNWNEANLYYQKALIYKPKETYPLEKLFEIDSLKSYAWMIENSLFEESINKGDSFFIAGDYRQSQEYYSEALTIFPRKVYPQQMIHKIDSIKRQESDKEIEVVAENPVVIEIPEAEPFENTTVEFKHSVNTDFTDETENQQDTQQIIPESMPFTAIEQEVTEKDTVTGLITQSDDTESISDALQGLAYNGEETEDNVQQLEQALKERIQAGDKKGSSNILTEIGKVYQSDFELAKALESYNRSLIIKRELKDKPGEAEVMCNIASVLYDSGSYTTAIQTFEQSLEISEEINDPAQSAEILASLGTVYESTYRYDEAIESFNRSLEIKNEMGDKEGTSEIYKKIGTIYFEQNNYKKAIEELEKSYLIDVKLENKDEMASGLNSMGAAYYSMNQYERAFEYFERSLNFTREANNLQLEAITLNNMGNVSFINKRFNKAIEYYEKSLNIKTDLSLKEGIATTLYNIGNSYFALKQFSKALEYYNSSQQVAEEVNYKLVIWKNLEAFAKTFASMGRYKEAFEKYREYTQSKYEFSGQTLQLIELREQYESSKIAVKTLKRELQKQNRIAQYEAERNRKEMQIIQLEMDNKMQQLKRTRVIVICIIVGSILILIFSVVITRQYRLTHKAYKLVANQKKHITDGISYAARIQKAVLPPKKYTQRVLPEYFILNKPREVVGGDFYWVATHYNKTVVAVSDCTGHGVPGGFMSMLGIAILNEIISIERPLESHEILTQLRDRLVEALHQKQGLSDSMDGMDITLVILDLEKKELQFSAAYHSLYLIRDGDLEKIKGDRVPIGYHRLTKPFTSQSVKLMPGDMIYLTTDGFIDQIGQKTKDRFMFSKFKNELLAIHKKPLREQEAHLEKVLTTWKGKMDQTDDILVMGLRF